MNKLTHFMLPENTNRLYQKEARSSISLTKDVANKINDLVDAYNELSTKDLAWKQEQEGIIRGGIIYLKDNLQNSVDDMMTQLKENGFIESRVKENIQYLYDGTVALTNRLDNLLGKVTQGSTTMDAEIIDARVGANNENYVSSGDAIRTQIKNLQKSINTLNNMFRNVVSKNNYSVIEYTSVSNKLINLSGKIDDYLGQPTFYVSNPISVQPNEMYLISGSSWYNHVICGIYDKLGNMIYSLTDENSTIVKELKDFFVVIPTNAVSMRIAYDSRKSEGVIKKINYLDTTSAYAIQMMNNIGDYLPLENKRYNLDLPISYESQERALLEKTSSTPVNYDNVSYKVTNLIRIESGFYYKVKAYANYGNKFFIIYDANMSILKQSYSDNNSNVQEFDKLIWIPYNAKYIRIAYISSSGYASIEKVLSFNESIINWNGIKWVAFGDSLTEHNSKANTNYTDYIHNETGIQVINYGVSGTGYARTNENFYTRILELKNVDFDVITIFGSGNDLGSGYELGVATDVGTETIAGCINQTLDNLYRIKPFVKVGLITPTPWKDNTPDLINPSMEQYSDLLVAIAKRRSIPCLDLYHESNLHPEQENFRIEFYNENGVQDNGVHPNSKGHKLISTQIREFLSKLI